MNDKLSFIDPPSGEVMSVATYIKGALGLVADEGTGIDTGGGFSQRDMWVKIDGKEFMITVSEAGGSKNE